MKKGGFGKNKPVLITIVALVVLAAMILASAGRGTANWFENAVGAVLTPVQGFAARASNSIADNFIKRRTQNSKASLHSITKCSWNLRSLKKRTSGCAAFWNTPVRSASVRVLRHPSRGGQRIFIFGFSPLMPDGIRALMLTCP